MIFKRPSFRRGGNSGIASIGGGTIRGNPMGSRTGFAFPGMEYYGEKPTIRTNLPLSTPFGNFMRGAVSYGAPIAAQAGLAYLNRPKTTKALKYMKEMSGKGIMDETSALDYEDYAKTLLEKEKEGDPISFTDAFFLDPETGTYPKILGRTKDIKKRAEIEKQKKIKEELDKPSMSGDPTQFTGEDKLTDFEAIKAAQGPEKSEIDITEESSITLDPKAEIEKEAKFLKELLQNESLTRGENALIIAEAIKGGGSLSEKISKAADLALPTIKRRDKQDKAITLKAYENFKRKELEQTKANKPTPEMRNIRTIAEARKRQNNDKRPLTVIMDEVIIEQQGGKEGTKIVTAAAKEIIDVTSSIDKQRGLLAVEQGKKKPNADRIKKIEENIRKLQKELGRYATFEGFDKIYRGYRKEYLADGGRVNRANGSPIEGETMEVAETIADTPGAPTPEKQVLKLSYAELRNKLPKEITDDVVELLANSTEALQDFAYITTQDDVGNFNIKYGVNLVIPPTTA